ncbi:ABC transporter substrate-binding protein [Allonocardiopsis opalescens]|uniref:Iron complex transport system substrate-binding protein n=1 Tax=Allonocardiopsis opalescens TaxID=1144618 RepID=A0A2T0PZ64_9ACTN|nr:ABC transporter substrate-binding protein [Allonocardiopsis opalescens]PRX96818.1 iron complex transport system substrate-binding protein [Allonocardiopsis opalescens]
MPWSPHARTRPARRRSRLAAAVLLTGALAAGCGAIDAAGEAAGAGGAEEGAWTYQDARAGEISLPARPERIVAHASAAAALIPLGITPVGIYGDTPMEENPALEGYDLTGVTSVGEVWGEVSVEGIAELDPDLFVTGYFPLEEQLGGFEADDDARVQAIESQVPIASVEMGQAASATIDDFVALAESLGADLDAPRVAEARAAYQAAVAEFQEVVADRPELSVVATSANDQYYYVAHPPAFPELQDYQEWGLDLVGPDPESLEDPGYFGYVSHELIDEYPADIIYYDGRDFATSAEELDESQPAWRSLAAVENDQVVTWYTDTFTSWERYAEYLTTLTDALRDADDLVP